MKNMNELRKAAEMALEALENNTDFVPVKTGLERETNNAIQALRQALAEPEHEPVAWVIEDGEVDYYVDVVAKIKPGTPLYIAPPKHEWVGLDGKIPGLGLVTEEFYNGMLFAEDYLREKNT